MPSALKFELVARCSVSLRRSAACRFLSHNVPDYESARGDLDIASRTSDAAALYARRNTSVSQGPYAAAVRRDRMPTVFE
jgi:hypothetical protein